MICRRKCRDCSACIDDRHHAAQLCHPCRRKNIANMPAYLTPEQKAHVLRLSGTHTIKQISDEVGISISKITRFRKLNNLARRHRRYTQETINDVLRYYEQHGRVATQKHFPDVNVPCITDVYEHAPRVEPWKQEDLFMVVRMAGLAPPSVLAGLIHRRGMHAGTIESVLFRKMGITRVATLHGLGRHCAKWLAYENCPFVVRPLWRRRTTTKQKNPLRRTYLWCDLVRHMRADIPDFVREGISAMADFQRWLFKNDNPRPVILKMMHDIQGYGDPERLPDKPDLKYYGM